MSDTTLEVKLSRVSDIPELNQVYKIADDVLKADLRVAQGIKKARTELRKSLMALAKAAKAAKNAVEPAGGSKKKEEPTTPVQE